MPEIGEIRNAKDLGFRDSHKYIWAPCQICKQPRWVRLRPQPPHCSICAGKELHRTGSNNPQWKGGKLYTKRGYIWIKLQPDDFFYSMTNTQGYIPEHRLVVAKALGRNLQSWEVVHYKHAKYPVGSVENKQDNRYPENLELTLVPDHNRLTLMEQKIKRLEDRLNEQSKQIKLLKWQLRQKNEQCLYGN